MAESEMLFGGHDGRGCGEHRTVGVRAWCFDCQEWCYPSMPCARCELPALRSRVARLTELGNRLYEATCMPKDFAMTVTDAAFYAGARHAWRNEVGASD